MQTPVFTSNKPYLFRAIYEWLLDNDATPYILVDTSLANVEVPNEHIQNGQIVLNASPSAIRHWLVDNNAVSFSARFSGKPRQIYVPMEAILAIYSQENGLGMAFPAIEEEQLESGLSDENESLPEESVQIEPKVVDSNKELPPKKNNTPQNKNNSHLKVVK